MYPHSHFYHSQIALALNMAEQKYTEEETEFLQIVSENIPYYRKIAEKTQKEVADDIDWEEKNYRKIEKGKRLSNGLVYKKIAESLAISVDKLYENRKIK